MISVSDYLRDPCGSLSIPYWKASKINLPDNMKILHQREFSEALLSQYDDEVYFRLIHRLQNIQDITQANAYIITASSDKKDIEETADIINKSYDDIKVDRKYLESLINTPVYLPSLWIFAAEPNTGEKVGCAIADYDPQCREMILEWVQVLPEYRRKGIGKLLVQQLLLRSPEEAKFATVSGKAANLSNPEALYRSCGFEGEDYWHVLTEKAIVNNGH